MARRRLKKGRLIRFILIVAIIVTVIIFKAQISKAIYNTTGITWFLSSNERHELALAPTEVDFKEVQKQTAQTNTDQSEPTPTEEGNEKLKLPDGNNVLGITYSAGDLEPGALAIQSDTIYKIKIMQVNSSTNGSMIFTEYQAQVKKVFKGQDNKEINFSVMGGSLAQNKLLPGYVQEIAGKTQDKLGQTVNLIVDGQEALAVGAEYIMFAGNQNGIITPNTGRSSFFLVKSGKVSRNTMHGEQPFEMKLGEFEKKFLK